MAVLEEAHMRTRSMATRGIKRHIWCPLVCFLLRQGFAGHVGGQVDRLQAELNFVLVPLISFDKLRMSGYDEYAARAGNLLVVFEVRVSYKVLNTKEPLETGAR
jgi:hypothetical protein